HVGPTFFFVNDKWVPHVFFKFECHLTATSTPRGRRPGQYRHVCGTSAKPPSKSVEGVKLHRF
ncbi:Os01g0198702, partial [Oryza sativa Japonica Group]